MIIVGIDPGLKGAIAFVKGKKKAKVYMMPTLKITKSKKSATGSQQSAMGV